MQQIKNLVVEGPHNKPIGIDVNYVKVDAAQAVVIFSHGFKGFKDWGHFNLLAERFARAGFVFVKFNFSHNGTSPDHPEEFVDLEAFGHNNFTIELDDLGSVIDWVCSAKELAGVADLSQIYLLGHSRGGGISILKAAEDDRIKKVATWAAIAEFGHFWSDEIMEQWKRDGVLMVPNSRTNQEMPMYYQQYEDFYANKERLDIPAAAARLNIPHFIAHAEDDPTVKVEAAQRLESLSKHSELLILTKGGHTFQARHPWTEDTLPGEAAEVVSKTIDFFKR